MLSKVGVVDAAIHALFDVNRLLRDAGERVAVAAGQTHARRMVLQAAQPPATVADIARALRLHRQGVQRIADELVDDGLAQYEENPRHKRSKLLVVAEPGHSALALVRDGHASWLEELRDAAPDVDWSTLLGELESLATSLRTPR
jgi:DNA-binding MarR family transcriptional regulator